MRGLAVDFWWRENCSGERRKSSRRERLDMVTSGLLKLGLGMALMVFPACANLIIDFTGFVPGGSVTGNASTLTGSGLNINLAIIAGAPQNDGIYSYTSGSYNVTGSITSIPGISGALMQGTINQLTVDLLNNKVVLASGLSTSNTSLVSYVCPTCIPSLFQFVGAST